jgi:hypothetical protein
MNVLVKYVIYELNSVLGNNNYKALERVEFDSWTQNDSFDTEEDAIQALINNKMMYIDYIILKQVYIN